MKNVGKTNKCFSATMTFCSLVFHFLKCDFWVPYTSYCPFSIIVIRVFAMFNHRCASSTQLCHIFRPYCKSSNILFNKRRLHF